MTGPAATGALPAIPIVETEGDWVIDVLTRERERLMALLDAGAGRIPTTAVRIADGVSRRWLMRHDSPSLSEIERIAAIVGRPGAFFLNVSYEWGCTTRAAPGPDGGSARLVRVLDWPDPGLGRYILAVRVAAEPGPFLSLTWPAYTGVLQAVAPGRFAAALNHAPMDTATGLLPLDWLAARAQVWRRPHPPAAWLLRRVFETAPDYAEARRMLIETPIAVSAIFTLAGLAASETCVIQRRPDAAHVTDGPAVAANIWQGTDWTGRARGEANPERIAAMAEAQTGLDPAFPWLQPPILNDGTRLVFVADAATGAFLAQGYEPTGPATAVLSGTA